MLPTMSTTAISTLCEISETGTEIRKSVTHGFTDGQTDRWHPSKPSVQNCQKNPLFGDFLIPLSHKFTPRQDFWAHSYISQRIPLNPLTKELDGWQGPSELVLIHLYTIWDRFFAFCRFLSSVIQRHGYMVWTLDKPARLIIRLLFRFASDSVFDKLNQSTNSETAMLSNEHSSPIHASWIHVSYINGGLDIWTRRYWSSAWVTRLDQPKGVKHKVKKPKLQEDVGPQQGP